MSGWTKWRRLAYGKEWYGDQLDNDGPACYELGIGGLRSRNPEVVYVGETKNEARRMRRYGSLGSHLRTCIEAELRKGRCLFYRAQAKPSKKAAKTMQDNLLARYEYDWNIQNNPCEDD